MTGSAPPAARVVLSQPIERGLAGDPFVMDPERFPPGRTAASRPAVAVLGRRADEAIREQAAALELQSTLCGEAPLACISGQFVRPGQGLGGFTLERVEPTRGILEREGVKVALRLE